MRTILDLYPGLIHPNQKKATKVAFYFFPICMAFFLSTVLILTMITFRPADQALAGQQRPSNSTNDHDPSASKPIPGSIAPLFTNEIHHWENDIIRWASEYDLDPNLIAILMQIESCGFQNAESSSGAIGLFQVMPFNFDFSEEPFEPDTNAKRGLSYFSRAIELAGGDLRLAFAGYNGGHGVIQIDPKDWYSETKRYVYWSTGILADLHQGKTESPHLQEWLNSGGASLCTLASQAHASNH